MIGVYRITHTPTGDCYVGKSVDIKQRWAEHRYRARHNMYRGNPLYKAERAWLMKVRPKYNQRALSS